MTTFFEELSIDVGDRSDEMRIAASLFTPPFGRLSDPPTVAIMVPGGTYTRAYWHLEVQGHQAYSCAEHLTADGLVVIAIDNVGTGASTRPPTADDLTFDMLAAVNAMAATQVAYRLEAGALSERLPPLAHPRLVGIGHSLGGQLIAVQQAEHRTYERIAVLGSSFLGNANLGTPRDSLPDDALAGAHMRLAALAPDAQDDGYLEVRRDLVRPQFHLPDVPAEVLAADEARATVLPRQLALQAMAPAAHGTRLAEIDVPVFLTFAEIDTSPDPAGEVALYRSSPDVTLFRLSGSAHCHNQSRPRRVLWNRLLHWLSLPSRNDTP